jgi:poly(hydroxyalkanoate) depolymerase family esterase
MRDFGKAMTHLHALHRKFEKLITTAKEKTEYAPQPTAAPTAPLREITGFGPNPGALRMFAHVPERLPALAPLVVALHGCGQDAVEFAYGTGWSSLADRLGFAVVYPQQQPANNPKNCFSWFLPGDTARDAGEARSIQQMVAHAIATFDLDSRRVFVTGLSAGGAMASVMLATYPEIFAGGAIIAGLPYGCARSAQQAFEVMFTDHLYLPTALGDHVRAASSYAGPWPKISIWHGTVDQIVKPCNAENIARQWADVHGLSTAPSLEESIGRHTRRVWCAADGEPIIESFTVEGMGHGVPLASTMGAQSCGVPGAFFLEAGISSTEHIARMWGLGDDAVQASRPPAVVSLPARVAAVGMDVVPHATDARLDSDEALFGENAEPDASYPLDPNLVIAAAFKAAGLAAPEFAKTAHGAAPQVAPGPIIAAALKAAGRSRR